MRAAYDLMSAVLFSVLLGLVVPQVVESAEPSSLNQWFQQGNEWYRQGDFEKAMDHYRAILEAGFDSAVLEYNLGNTEVHRNNLAQALVHYDRAAVLGLRDPDWRANQNYVLRKLGWPKGHPSASHPIWALSLQGWMATATVLLWIGLGLVFASLFFKTPCWIKGTGAVAFVAGLICAGMWFWQWHLINVSWVVLRPSAARFEPREEATVHYPLRPGEVVRRLRFEKDWIKVRSLQGRVGWMPLSHAATMNPYRAYKPSGGSAAEEEKLKRTSEQDQEGN